jgi:hypothetical protein
VSPKYRKVFREETLPNGVRIEIDNLDPTFIATAYDPDGKVLKQEVIPSNLGEVYFDMYRELFIQWQCEA